jgi:hypothetical protein
MTMTVLAKCITVASAQKLPARKVSVVIEVEYYDHEMTLE